MPIVVDPNFVPPPPPVVVTSPDGRITALVDPALAGVTLKADFSGDATLPEWVRFYRGEVLVRSGDPAPAPGGIAVAYDHEAPLGVGSQWSAVPVYRDGSEGAATASVGALMPEDLSVVRDVWLKSSTDPSLALQALVTIAPAMKRAGRVNLDAVPGSPYPVGSWDLHSGYDWTLTVLTESAAERATLEALLDQGPILVQSVTAVDLEDMHVLPADLEWDWIEGSRSAGRQWTVPVAQIERPSTTGAVLRIPGRSCQDVLESYPSCDALAAQVGSCLELLGVS